MEVRGVQTGGLDRRVRGPPDPMEHMWNARLPPQPVFRL
jgi:hypothetical protein